MTKQLKARDRMIAAIVFACALSALGGAQTFWVVDAANGPGANFTTVSAAVAAALPGDRVFVRPGLYVENVLIDKGITVVGWNATTYPMTVPVNPYAVAIQGTLAVINVDNAQTAVVSGLTIVPNGAPGYSVALLNSRGALVLDRIVIEDGSLLISFGEDVLLQDVRIRAPQTSGATPWNGIDVVNSWVQANDLDVVGGSVGAEPNFAPTGGSALAVHAPSIVALARPKLVGGSGGGPWVFSPSTPAGGVGIQVFGGIVSMIDDTTNTNFVMGGDGGFRGAASSPTIASGDGGHAIVVSAGYCVNKKPLVPTPGVPGVNLAGGPLGSPGLESSASGSGTYTAAFDVPANFRVVGTTIPGGMLTLTLESASPGLLCGLGATSDFDLAVLVLTPSVQFSAGKPSAVQFFGTATSNAQSLVEFFLPLPGVLGPLAGASGMAQGADVVNGQAFLTNPSVVVFGY